MSRFEGEIQAAGPGPIALAELLSLLADAALPECQRQAAIACYLSAGEGWRDASQLLGGAFAGHASPPESDEKTRLNEGKDA